MQQATHLLGCAGGQALPSEAAREVVLQAAQAFFDSASSLEAEEIGLGQVTLGLLPHDPEAGQLGSCLQALQELQDYGLHLLPVDYNQVRSFCWVALLLLSDSHSTVSRKLLSACDVSCLVEIARLEMGLDIFSFFVLLSLYCNQGSRLCRQVGRQRVCIVNKLR